MRSSQSCERSQSKESPALSRFLAKVEVGPGCWHWRGAGNGVGYGRFMVDARRSARKMVYAHRFAYEQFIGPIPEGLVIDHLCRNPGCVRPDHLEPVEHGENLRRGYAARRGTTHCLHGHRWDEIGPSGLPNLAHNRGKKQYRYCRRCARERKPSEITTKLRAIP